MGFGDMDSQLTARMMGYVLHGSWPKDEEDIDQEVEELMEEVYGILEEFGDNGERGEKAKLLLDLLVPTEIDVSMWRKIAAGENIHLPASDEYGPVAPNLRPKDKKVASPARGNAHGTVHSKGKQAPSEFMKRQGQAIHSATRRIIELEEDLREARERQMTLQHGLKTYATTCLLTAIRQAAAPVFAMGPAWTLLTAIQSKSEKETFPGQDKLETARILVVLHALREHQAFQRELKAAMLSVCNRYEAAARERNPDHEFGNLNYYDSLLPDLEWPEHDRDFKWRQEQPCARCAERDRLDELLDGE